jgi:endoglucanase
VNGNPHARRLGETVGGKYRLLRYLAAGGMGAVYEAQHTVVGRRFAVKLLHPDLAAQRESLHRFQREAQAAGALENEHVAAVIDFGIAEDGSPFMVMEYLAGESLRTLLDRCRRLPVPRATDIAVQASRGIGAAHRAGIVHRDLNPQNLFVCRREDGTDLVKVLDFGIAKLESLESAETRTGAIMGTPAYLAPEQARGEKAVDHRADVYGLGAVLYELLSGRKPHPGDSHNAILHHICTQPALPLEAEPLGLPPGLAAVVERALSSQPGDRQESAEAFGRELAPWAEQKVWPAPSPTASDVAASEVPPASTVAASGRAGTPERRRWLRKLLIASLVFDVLLGLGIAYYFLRRPLPAPGIRPLPLATRFFVPPPNPGAVEQIAALAKANSPREAAAITAMAAVPQAVWFSKGTPEEVHGAVRNLMVRAAHDRSLRVLVANNRPYRDCAGLSAGGAKNSAVYAAWIDAFARGIGNERAVVILEPDSTGMLPYHTSLDGSKDPCRPTVSDGNGNLVPAPDANPDEAYGQIRRAVAALVRHAPNAYVYLDGTHAGWLPVGETAYRLHRSDVLRTQGFAVNISNYQTTAHSIRYGTWVSQCLDYATRVAPERGKPAAFRRCPSQPPAGADEQAWERTGKWYAEHAAWQPERQGGELSHFVIDTSRNGRGPLATGRYALPPFNQPDTVIAGLTAGAWCNPPGMGMGLRPTADTRVPLLDAYLWIKTVGESDGACDIAGGARAWDYDKYNPWGITGEAQKHFDPLWGMIDPAAGTWFPELALGLALRADPPLLP